MNEKQELTALLENAVVEVEFTKVNGDLVKNIDGNPFKHTLTSWENAIGL